MKKFMLSVLVTFALCAATAFAQAGAQGTQRSNPSMGSPNAQQQPPGANQPGYGQDQTSPTAPTDQNTPNANHENTGKSLKGCVESQGGQYVLETKKGSIPLTGQDVSAHAGHEVKVKGTWEKSTSSATGTESSSGAMSGKAFNVSSVDMVSETCKMKGKGSSSGTGTGAGTGTGTSNQPQ